MRDRRATLAVSSEHIALQSIARLRGAYYTTWSLDVAAVVEMRFLLLFLKKTTKDFASLEFFFGIVQNLLSTLYFIY